MADFTQKAGDSLSDLEVRLIDRKRKPLDLTNATSVLLYVRNWRESTNDIDGEACEIQGADVEEEYPQRVKGPNVELEIGQYSAYFKVLYGSVAKRVPSKGYFTVEVESSLE